MTRFVLIFLSVFVPLAAVAGNLAQEPVVFESGNWRIHRGSDAMTDKVSCTGVYKSDFGIQLSASDLFIHVSGGIEQIQVRFDDDPPGRSHPVSEVERKIGSVNIAGSEFDRALHAKRLRTSILTNVSGVHEDDIDLAGIEAAHDSIANGCPGEPLKSAARSPTVSPVADGCSERAKVKMKIKGLSDADIKEICAK